MTTRREDEHTDEMAIDAERAATPVPPETMARLDAISAAEAAYCRTRGYESPLAELYDEKTLPVGTEAEIEAARAALVVLRGH